MTINKYMTNKSQYIPENKKKDYKAILKSILMPYVGAKLYEREVEDIIYYFGRALRDDNFSMDKAV